MAHWWVGLSVAGLAARRSASLPASAQVDLLTGAVSKVVDAGALRERNEGAWVADILSADDDGTTLLCRVGCPRKLPDGSPTGGIGYSLCRVVLATSDIQTITPLRQVFF